MSNLKQFIVLCVMNPIMSWSRQEVTLLIEQYEKHPCLFAVNRSEYKNKHAKNKALQNIQEVIALVRPGTTINDIKAKLQGLKTNFLTEHRKYAKSVKSGAGDDDIYRPTLWYYSLLLFILDFNIPRAAVDNIVSQETAGESETHEFETQWIYLDSPSASEPTYEGQSGSDCNSVCTTPLISPLPANPASKPSKKRKAIQSESVLTEAAQAISQISAAIKERTASQHLNANIKPKEVNEFNVFGEFVAQKLKQMSADVANEVEEEITKLLFEGCRKTKDIA